MTEKIYCEIIHVSISSKIISNLTVQQINTRVLIFNVNAFVIKQVSVSSLPMKVKNMERSHVTSPGHRGQTAPLFILRFPARGVDLGPPSQSTNSGKRRWKDVKPCFSWLYKMPMESSYKWKWTYPRAIRLLESHRSTETAARHMSNSSANRLPESRSSRWLTSYTRERAQAGMPRKSPEVGGRQQQS